MQYLGTKNRTLLRSFLIKKPFYKGLPWQIRIKQARSSLFIMVSCIKSQSQRLLLDRINAPNATDIWTMFIETKKIEGKTWYEASAIIRSPTGFCIIICRSLDVENKKFSDYHFVWSSVENERIWYEDYLVQGPEEKMEKTLCTQNCCKLETLSSICRYYLTYFIFAGFL